MPLVPVNSDSITEVIFFARSVVPDRMVELKIVCCGIVRGTPVSDTGVQIFGFHGICGSNIGICLRLLHVEGCRTVAVYDDTGTTRVSDTTIPPVYIVSESPRQIGTLTRVCTKCVTNWYRFVISGVNESL